MSDKQALCETTELPKSECVCPDCGPRDAVPKAISDAAIRRLNSEALAEMHSRGLQSFSIDWWPAFTRYVLENAPTFQARVQPWLMACFGEMIAGDREERNHRFFEEATELVQARGMSASEAHQLVDYVYGRPVGEAHQEVGGVMVTLAALCLANGLDMHEAGETELARIWTKVEKIRAKQAAKPKHSPLPEHVTNANIADQAAVSYAIDALRHAQLCIACERASCDSDERGQWDRYQHAINGLLGHAAQPETKA